MLDRFDAEWLRNTFTVAVLDGEGNDDRRTARLCSTVNTSLNNAMRRCGKDIPDSMYRSEDEYMPPVAKQPVKPQEQSWEEMKRNLNW